MSDHYWDSTAVQSWLENEDIANLNSEDLEHADWWRLCRTAALTIEAALKRIAALEAELARRDEYNYYNACATGDCPHETVHECVKAQAELISEQNATIEEANATIAAQAQQIETLRTALLGIETALVDTELNMSNYNEDEVSALNNAATEAWTILLDALDATAPATEAAQSGGNAC